MIYADPTEFRLNSPLGQTPPPGVNLLPGLEAFTGADFLCTPQDKPVLTDAGILPQQILLTSASLAGALIQRKSFGDMATSIPGLHGILQRMREKSPRCYLAPVGVVQADLSGNAVISGKSTALSYKSYMGAINTWTVDGGLIPTPLTDNAAFYEWLFWLDAKILDRTYHQPSAEVANIPQAIPQIALLLTIPGIGIEKAKALWEFTGGLWECLTFLTNYESLKLQDRIPGIGKGIIEKARQFFGVPDDAYAIGLYLEP